MKTSKMRVFLLSLALVMVITSLALVNAFANGETCTCGGTYDNGFCDCGAYQPATLTTGKYDMDGDEIMDSVFEIGNAGQLYWFAAQVNGGNTTANAVLTEDITVNTGVLNEDCALNGDGSNFRTWTPIGNWYRGIFDGQGHTISGLYCNAPNQYYVGLFGNINSSAKLENLRVKDSYFCGDYNVGGVVGHNYGTVTNCYSSATASGNCYVSGIVGSNYGTVTNCYNGGTAIGTRCGGVAGENNGTMTDCYNTGVINGNSQVGGVIGSNSGTIENCYNTAVVTGDSEVGGVAGSNSGTIENCYNTAAVSGKTAVGGMVGYNSYQGIPMNCYNTGAVTGESNVGGVAGFNYYGAPINCYNTGNVNGKTYVGGVVGENFSTVENCYNAGLVSGNSYVGGVAGHKDYGTAKNCYYLDQVGDVANPGGMEGADVAGQAVGKTQEQFASGEVAALLGEAFCQGIGVDTYPEFHAYVNGFCTNNCTVAPYEKPKQDAEGWYLIDNGGKLYWFADYVNNKGNASANAKLGANIVVNTGVLNEDGIANYDGDYRTWTPIGSESNPYTGSFDGQNYTISGLYCDTSGSYVGLYGYIGSGATVKNVGVKDSCFMQRDWDMDVAYVGAVVAYSKYGMVQNCYSLSWVYGAQDAGGIVGYNYQGTVKNCYNTGRVNGDFSYAGGVVGYNYYGSVENCYNTGKIDGGQDAGIGGVVGCNYYGTVEACYNTGKVQAAMFMTSGGIVGYNYGTVKNCYNIGAVDGDEGNVGGVVGYNEGTVANSYYLEGCASSEYGSVNSYGTAKTEAQFNSGEVAYLLNGDQTTIVFGQMIGTDDYPVFFNGENQVYAYKLCPSKTGYANAPAPADNEEHNFVDSMCIICGELQPPAQDEDGYYIITTVGELYWFADYVNNKGHYDANAKLGNDITVNENVLDEDGYLNEGEFRVWMPIAHGYWYRDVYDDMDEWIGTEEGYEYYSGHFDGQGFTISGLYYDDSGRDYRNYIGFFGAISEDAVVENLTLKDTYIYGIRYVGGIVGGNHGMISNCAIIDSYVHGILSVGGIAGFNEYPDEAENVAVKTGIYNCYNSGTDVGGHHTLGGIVGYTNMTVENCYNSGAVEGTWDEKMTVGGIAGSNSGVVINCYNSGDIKGSMEIGGVVGYSDGAVENCYNRGTVYGWSEVGAVVGRNSGTVTNCYYLEGCAEENNEYGTPKTEAEFASGEVMLLLGEAFGQDLSKGEKWPTLGGPRYTMIVAFTNGEEVYYEDLAEAVAAAEEDAGCTLIMLADSFKGEAVINAGNFNLEFRGKQMNSTLVVAEKANITIKNGKFTNITAQNDGQITINGETVTLCGVLKAEDGEITIIEAAVEAGLKLEGITLNEILDRNSFGRNEDNEVVTALSKIRVIRPGASLDEATITVDDAAYTGEAVTPEVVITIGGKMLEKGVDFDITYTNNTALGINTAEVTIRAIAPYTGEKTVKFSIVNCATDFGAQIEALKERLAELERKAGENDAIQTAIAEIRAEIAEILQDYATNEDLEDALVRIAALETRVNDLEARMAAAEAEIARLTGILNTLQTALETLQIEIPALQEAVADLQTAIDNLDDTYVTEDELAAAIAGVESKIAELKQQIEATLQAYATKTEVEGYISQLQDLINTNTGGIETINALLEAINAELAKLKNAEGQYRLDVIEEILKQLLETTIPGINDLIAKNAENIGINAEAIAALQETVSEIQTTVGELAAEDARLAELIAGLETRLSDLQTSLEKALEALKEELLGELKKAKEALEEALKELKDANDEKAKALEEAIRALEKLIEETETSLKTYTDEAVGKALNEARESLDAAIAEVEQKLADATQKLEEAIRSGNADLAQQIEKVRTALNAAIAANNATAIELTEQINKAKSALQSAINKLEADLEQAKLELYAAIIAGDADLDEKIAALQTALDAAIVASDAADDALRQELREGMATLNVALAANAAADEATKAELTAKANKLNTLVIVAIVIASVAMAGCAGLVTYIIIEKRKLIK